MEQERAYENCLQNRKLNLRIVSNTFVNNDGLILRKA